MKKLAAILLILILAALCVPAFAMETDGLGDTVARNAELAAFLDGSGNIYVSGLDRPVNATKADSLVSIDPYRILFFAQADASAGIPQTRLISLSLDGFAEAKITDDAYAACLDEENVYYVSNANRTQLVRYNLDSGTGGTVFTAAEALDRIYASSIGVITTVVDGAGAYITDPISGQFVPYANDAAREIEQGDGFEAFLTDSSSLYVRVNGALSPTLVDGAVRAWAVLGHNLYYLSGNDGALSLKQYNVDANLWTFVLALPADIQAQLTASANSLFVISNSNEIYSVDVAGKRLVNYATLPTPQTFAVDEARSVTGYRIEAVSGQLNVYGVMEDTSSQPTFTFVDFNQGATKNAAADIMLLKPYVIDAESTVWDLMQPAPQYSPLRRGSRGDAVSAIQQPLYDKGYYNYYIDGIFGWRTERAVKLLQDMLGLSVNGVADESLQRTILTTDIPAYDPYRALRRGDRGLRVTEMQQRLRDLGYLADDADSVFGPRTLAAVELFQSENGLGVDGIAGPETLRRLYSDSARTCSSYIDLRKGDTGYRVRELNRRLKELYYLEGDVGSTYTAATAEAVRRFQQEVGMRQTGEATEAMQRELFSRNAPEYSGYVTLRRGDDSDRVLDMQRRLKELDYYDGALDGYFGKGTYAAVRAFQRQVGLKVTGVADPKTLERLYDSDAPAYQAPVELTEPVVDLIGIYDTDEDGVYLLTDSPEYIKFFWSADGVESYDVTLDDGDETYTLIKNEFTDEIEITTADMFEDTVYTLTVTAHPQDKANNADASSELRFMIVSEAEQPTLDGVIIHIDGDYTYVQEDDIYEIKKDALKFTFTTDPADFAVDHYAYTVGVEGSDAAIDDTTPEAALDLTASEAIEEDTDYTLTVTAYPDAESTESIAAAASLRFRITAELPAVPDEPATDDEEATDPNGEEATGDEVQDGASDASLALPDVQAAPAIAEIPMDVTAPDGTVSTENVTAVGEGSVELTWATEGEVTEYNVRITDESGNTMVDQNLTSIGAHVDSDNLVSGEVYTMTATAYFEGGESTSATLYFMKPSEEIADESAQETVTDEPIVDEPATEEPAADETTTDEPTTDEPTTDETTTEEPAVDETTTDEPAADETTTDEPAADETTTDEPTVDEPVPAANPLGSPAVQANPNTGAIEMEVAHPDGSMTTEVVITVGDGDVQLSWAAEGDVAGYQVVITDSSDNVMVNERLTNIGATINAQNLMPGKVYKMTATAYSNNGEETAAALYFMRPVSEPEPAPETSAPEVEQSETGMPEADVPYDEPAADVPHDEPVADEPYDEPVADEPYSEPEVDEPTVDEPYSEPEVDEPTVDEPYSEPEVDEPTADEPYSEPEVDEPYDEPEAEEPEPEPTEEPTPEPTEEPTPEPTEEPTPEPEPEDPYPMDDPSAWSDAIDVNSDPDAISTIQKRLKKWGWLSDCRDGTLDDATVQAVIDLQNYCIESGLNVTVTDPADPIIETDTLRLLFNADGNKILKP